ncbi:MAG: hypothetical protein KF696_11795 [Planctomycetes bacterium]|nr:hypothetical protein [Planctomycetota bacterium]MCW8136971.1 hypothetical protein [Planctomycetota bacterium]
MLSRPCGEPLKAGPPEPSFALLCVLGLIGACISAAAVGVLVVFMQIDVSRSLDRPSATIVWVVLAGCIATLVPIVVLRPHCRVGLGYCLFILGFTCTVGSGLSGLIVPGLLYWFVRDIRPDDGIEGFAAGVSGLYAALPGMALGAWLATRFQRGAA